MTSNPNRPRIGLALGSGGARGWAHVGVLLALRERGVPVHCVAGTSMGALVGAAFAAGKLDALHDFALALDWRRLLYHFVEIGIPRSGLVDGGRIVATLRDFVQTTTIEELPLPFAAVATDVLTGREVVLDRGDAAEAVRASIAIPAMFTPVRRGDAVLVDGGLVNPLPVSVARALGADRVIAVDVTPGPPLTAPRRPTLPARGPAPRRKRTEGEDRLLERLGARMRRFDLRNLPAARRWLARGDVPGLFDVLGNSVRIVEHQITLSRLKVEPADTLIQPDVGGYSFMDFHKAAEIIQAGYTAALEAALPERRHCEEGH